MTIGRPKTGRKLNSSIKVDLDTLYQARVAAIIHKKTLGQWLEEAIVEKITSKRGRMELSQRPS